MYTPFKFVIQAVLVQQDDTGRVVGEASSETVAVYGLDGLREYLDGFEEELARLNEGTQ
jgi:hypothetical protein